MYKAKLFLLLQLELFVFKGRDFMGEPPILTTREGLNKGVFGALQDHLGLSKLGGYPMVKDLGHDCEQMCTNPSREALICGGLG